MNVDVSLFKPDCTIWLMAAKNIDRTYNHVYRIKRNEIDSFFQLMRSNKDKYGDMMEFPKCTPVRDEREGYFRIPANSEYGSLALMTANYIVWKNRNSTDTIYYYAFIDDIVFVNVHMVAVKATLDVFRTFLPLIKFRPCLIDRSHFYQGPNEKAGDNIFNEEFIKPMYHRTKTLHISELEKLCAAVTVSPVESKFFSAVEGVNQKVISALTDTRFELYDLSGLTSFVQQYSGRVQSVTLIPHVFIDNRWNKLTYSLETPTHIGADYIPRNKKLLTYPYTFFTVYSGNNSKYDYRYELFLKGEVKFIITGIFISGECKMYVSPVKYLTTEECIDPHIPSPEYSLSFSEFPQIPFPSDAWNEYFNNGGLLKMGQGIISALTGATSNAYGDTYSHSWSKSYNTQHVSKSNSESNFETTVVTPLSLSGSALNGLIGLGELYVRPDSVIGTSTGTIDMYTNISPFRFVTKQITSDQAERLDTLFDIYGYKDGEVRVLDYNIRPCWCYWKTAGIAAFYENTKTADGSEVVPSYVVDLINLCLQNGVTFWAQDKNLGGYPSVDGTGYTYLSNHES